MSLIATGALATAGLGLAGVSWGLAEAHAFTVRQVTVPCLDEGARPVRVLQISDLHLTPRQRDKVRWVRGLAELKPDLVVNTGDNLAHHDSVPVLLDALAPLLEIPGVFVNGSNDYAAPTFKSPFVYFSGPSKQRTRPTRLPTATMTDGFSDAGWQNLNNARAVIEVAGSTLSFAGMDDPHIKRDRMPVREDDRTSDLHIGVVHAPYLRALEALKADGAEVILAGHTHGGQVCVPGVGALVTNCDLDRGRAKGLHGWPGARPDAGGDGSSWLHVCAGAGTSPYAPVRFACRPEASLLQLVPRT